MKELRDIKHQLSTLSSIKVDITLIKNDVSDLKDTCNYMNEKMDDLSARVTSVETRVAELERLNEAVNILQNEIKAINLQLSTCEQRSRLNNVEIKGVPFKKDENLYKIVDAISRKVDFTLPKTQINYISRVPMHNSKEKLIIMSFINRYVKDDFIAAARLDKSLSTSDIGFQGSSNRIYVNDHLSIESKKILTATKLLAKEKNYKYVWVKHGKIHVRKNDSSGIIIIRYEKDLNKIA